MRVVRPLCRTARAQFLRPDAPDRNGVTFVSASAAQIAVTGNEGSRDLLVPVQPDEIAKRAVLVGGCGEFIPAADTRQGPPVTRTNQNGRIEQLCRSGRKVFPGLRRV